MQRKSLSLKRIILGILLFVAGLTLLIIIIPYPLYFQAPINVLLPSLATVYLCVIIIHLGGFILGTGLRADLQEYLIKNFTKILIPTISFGVWIFLVVLPIMVLPLPEEVSVLAISFSGLLFVLVIVYFEKWSAKRKEKRKKKAERKVTA